jgi:prevent-host-death family protein
LYKKFMPSHALQISEVRKRLSALVERVAQGGRPVAIGRYGRERAVLLGAEDYAKLTRKSKRLSAATTLEGSLALTCTPEALMAESREIGRLWLAGVESDPGKPPRKALRRCSRTTK